VLNYTVLSKNPEHFRNFTGLKLEEFNTLNQQVTEKYSDYEQKRLAQKQLSSHKIISPLSIRLWLKSKRRVNLNGV